MITIMLRARRRHGTGDGNSDLVCRNPDDPQCVSDQLL
jgi:hypothetical protein